MNTVTFKKILQEQKNRILSYAFYFLRNREDAEDVTQEVFVKLWQCQDEIDQNKVLPWMMRVAHNQCIDVFRKKKMNKSHYRISLNDRLETAGYQSDKMANPESCYEYSETQELLLHALKTLPEKTRSMMLLHYFQGFKYEMIGEILNISVNTVKVTIHRGKKKLKEMLEEQFPERVEKIKNECTM